MAITTTITSGITKTKTISATKNPATNVSIKYKKKSYTTNQATAPVCNTSATYTAFGGTEINYTSTGIVVNNESDNYDYYCFAGTDTDMQQEV